MICPRCSSENIHIQVKNTKSPIVTGCVLAVGGIGLMFLGILGVIVGVLIGLVIGLIIKAILPTPHESIAVCQNCGNTFNPSIQTVNITSPTPSIAPTQNTDILRSVIITRISNSCGSAIGLNISIDNSNYVILNNGGTITLKVQPGEHILLYEQTNGIGKKKRTGSHNLFVETAIDKNINIIFTPSGLNITEV